MSSDGSVVWAHDSCRPAPRAIQRMSGATALIMSTVDRCWLGLCSNPIGGEWCPASWNLGAWRAITWPAFSATPVPPPRKKTRRLLSAASWQSASIRSIPATRPGRGCFNNRAASTTGIPSAARRSALRHAWRNALSGGASRNFTRTSVFTGITRRPRRVAIIVRITLTALGTSTAANCSPNMRADFIRSARGHW